jgi:hypothetical protein
MASELAVSRPTRRRRYSAELKAEVLAQCDAPGASSTPDNRAPRALLATAVRNVGGPFRVGSSPSAESYGRRTR